MKRWNTRAAAAVLALAVALTACSSDEDDGVTTAAADDPTTTSESASSPIAEPVAVTYDGGIYLLDGETLEVRADIPLEGFNRVNPAGDDHHVFLSTEDGFRLLDAVHGELTDVTFDGPEPGHVVVHEGKTVLFMDGTGEVLVLDADELAEGAAPRRTYRSAEPHHGVAVELADGTLVTTLGTEEARPGALALDADGEEIARNEDCEGVHGEAVAADEVVSLGCKDGVLLWKDGRFVKVDAGPDHAAIGTQRGSEESPVLLGDYAVDPDAEHERSQQVTLIDTAAETIVPVALPGGASYSFRSLGRGAHGEAYVLGTDGAIHVIDPETAQVVASWPVVGAWEEPVDWQDPRPALFTRDHDVYVTEPATRTVYRLDGESGEVLAEVRLDEAPNEISGVLAGH